MSFLFSAPKIPPYTPPPPPPEAAPAPTTPEPTPSEETFSDVPLDADLPQSPEEVQARTKAVSEVEKVRRRRKGASGFRIPLNSSLSLATNKSGITL